MAKAWRKNNEKGRRLVALQNLKNAKFFEKGERTEEQWRERRDREIETLELRTR